MDFSFSDEQESFLASVRTFARERVAPRAADIDATGQYPRDLVAEAAVLGLLGVTMPVSQGGAGRDALSYAAAVEAVGLASATLAVILTVTNSLVVEPLRHSGSETQKAFWLPRLVSGQAIGAFALSEEQAGSDAANQQTTVQVDEGGYRLTGRKVWVANGEVADVAIVFATSTPGDRHAISAFLVPLGSPGISRTPSSRSGSAASAAWI